jgi:hypothetical protein
MHKFLLRFASITDADTVLAAFSYATFSPRDEEQVSIKVPVPMTIANRAVGVTETLAFLASQIKAMTLPNTVTRSRNVRINGGVNVATDFDYVVDNLQSYSRGREKWISFTVNGEAYEVPDNGGKILQPAQGVTLHDFDTNGWPLVNVAANYQADPQVLPKVIPGVFVVVTFSGDAYDADVRVDPADGSLWETSKLANSFKTNGTKRTYTCTAQQTDWGSGYSLPYYERTVGGAVVGMVNPQDLPAQILAQHGVLR